MTYQEANSRMVKHARAITAIVIASLGVLAAATSATAAAIKSRSHLSPRTPLGPRGDWRPVFDDEFNGSSLNQRTWNDRRGWTNQNKVTDSPRNISLRGGQLMMRLASRTSGAEIATNHFMLRVGEYAEARIRFNGTDGHVDNWPAWWSVTGAGPGYGENDIAEGLAGNLTINYHSETGTLNTGSVSGAWLGGFHTYGIYRGRLYSRVYWDGHLVRTYRTDDDGQPQTLVFTIGYADDGSPAYTGAAGEMVVDYVRAWAPA